MSIKKNSSGNTNDIIDENLNQIKYEIQENDSDVESVDSVDYNVGMFADKKKLKNDWFIPIDNLSVLDNDETFYETFYLLSINNKDLKFDELMKLAHQSKKSKID